MKLTNETKIGDLIPEGYELDLNTGSDSGIHINIKKKEEKDFEWYVNEYDKENNNWIGDIKCYFTFDRTLKDAPFEIRLGLFKFICNNSVYSKNSWIDIINDVNLQRGKFKGKFNLETLLTICPKEFLDSILD